MSVKTSGSVIDGQDTQAGALAAELRALFGKLRRRMREQADAGGLTASQISVLHHIEKNGGASVSAFARAEGVRPQSMGATVAALEASGFLRGAPDPGDGRQTIFSLTGKCRRWIRESRAARQDWLARNIQARLSAGEMKTLAAGVELLRRLADE